MPGLRPSQHGVWGGGAWVADALAIMLGEPAGAIGRAANNRTRRRHPQVDPTARVRRRSGTSAAARRIPSHVNAMHAGHAAYENSWCSTPAARHGRRPPAFAQATDQRCVNTAMD